MQGPDVGGVHDPATAAEREPAMQLLGPLLALTQQLSAATSHGDVAQIVASAGIEALGASAGFVAEATPDSSALEMLSHIRLDQASTQLCRLEMDEDLPVVDAWRSGA